MIILRPKVILKSLYRFSKLTPSLRHQEKMTTSVTKFIFNKFSVKKCSILNDQYLSLIFVMKIFEKIEFMFIITNIHNYLVSRPLQISCGDQTKKLWLFRFLTKYFIFLFFLFDLYEICWNVFRYGWELLYVALSVGLLVRSLC